jgi:glutamate mutase epsilon subunit
VFLKMDSALIKLVVFIKRRGGSATLREVTQSFWPLKNQHERANTMLEELVSAGRAKWEDVETTKHGGRPTRQIRLLAVRRPIQRRDGSGTKGKHMRNQAALHYALSLPSPARLAALKAGLI